jgi:DNA-binding CsgD family transcriptional regulator
VGPTSTCALHHGAWPDRTPRGTEREVEVVGLVARGHSNAEIARALWLSPFTVADHIKNVFEKTGVRSRGELTGPLFFDHYLPRP